MGKRYIIALDEGTTSARTLVYDTLHNKIISVINYSFKQYYPQSGWVEHDAVEIWNAQEKSLNEVIRSLKITAADIYCIGVTNQRESVVVWDKSTGEPIYNSICWQCRRTSEFCENLKIMGYEELIKNKTGLIIDAYFSASKIKWILDNVKGARRRAEKGELLAGTIDSYIIWKLTRGVTFVTDYSNASRTQLFNIKTLKWDKELLDIFKIPENLLAKVVDSSGIVGYATVGGGIVPISGIAGDQQSALFGQGCTATGMAKNTYGTGCFMLMNTGNKIISGGKLLTTIAWGLNGKITYALEGSIFNAGSCVNWMRDNMELIEKASDTESLCYSVEDTNGVYFVPAFTGLGAPYWDMDARGTIVGISRGVTKAHIVRAGMESMAYNTKAIIDEMSKQSGYKLKELRCDGGVSKDNFLMQFQSDILNCAISRQQSTECTAMGVVYLSGLAVGVFKDLNSINEMIKLSKTYNPVMKADTRNKLYKGWQDAVAKTIGK